MTTNPCLRSVWHPFGGLLALLFLLSLLVTTPNAFSQTVQLGGFIRAENAYDTRQVVAAREGQLLLYPQPDSEASRNDNLFFGAFRTRLRLKAAGTEALGAAVEGRIEADFFGAVNGNISTLRLRHAYARLSWTRHELLVGQYWSPLFRPSTFPGVVGGSAGAPFQPLARFPQIRYTWQPGALRTVAALTQQRDGFSEIGGNKQHQQSALPALHLHQQYGREGTLLGVGAYLKRVRPVLAGADLTAWAVQSYAKATGHGMEARLQATYGSDLTDHLMTGGYVTTETGGYEALDVVSTWVDLRTTAQPISVGLYAGYLTNLGASCEEGFAVAERSTRADDIRYLWRVAPRLTFEVEALHIGLELEATSVLYAAETDAYHRPVAASADRPVTNVRGLLAVTYSF